MDLTIKLWQNVNTDAVASKAIPWIQLRKRDNGIKTLQKSSLTILSIKGKCLKKFNPLLYWFYIENLGYEIILASKPIFPDIHIKACMTGMHSLHLNKTMQCMAIVNCIKMMSIHVYIYIIMLSSSNTLYLYTEVKIKHKKSNITIYIHILKNDILKHSNIQI